MRGWLGLAVFLAAVALPGSAMAQSGSVDGVEVHWDRVHAVFTASHPSCDAEPWCFWDASAELQSAEAPCRQHRGRGFDFYGGGPGTMRARGSVEHEGVGDYLICLYVRDYGHTRTRDESLPVAEGAVSVQPHGRIASLQVDRERRSLITATLRVFHPCYRDDWSFCAWRVLATIGTAREACAEQTRVFHAGRTRSSATSSEWDVAVERGSFRPHGPGEARVCLFLDNQPVDSAEGDGRPARVLLDEQSVRILRPVMPTLTRARADGYVRRALRREFGAAYAFRIRELEIQRCGRQSRLQFRCLVAWGIGDVGYRGRIEVRLTRLSRARGRNRSRPQRTRIHGQNLRWIYRFRIRRLDEYCLFVRKTGNCTHGYSRFW